MLPSVLSRAAWVFGGIAVMSALGRTASADEQPAGPRAGRWSAVQRALDEGKPKTALEALIRNAVVVETAGGHEVVVGSTVVVETEGEQATFTIVGSREADPANGRISYLSPIGAALMGRRAGEDAEVATPSGRRAYRVIEVR